MVRIVIASVFALAMLCMPASLRHDLLCERQPLQTPTFHAHHDHQHSHHQSQHQDDHSDCPCAEVEQASVGLGAVALAGVAVTTVAVPHVQTVVTLAAPASAVDNLSLYRPPPGRTRLATLSCFRI